MSKVIIGSEQELRIDRCRVRNRGHWLDFSLRGLNSYSMGSGKKIAK